MSGTSERPKTVAPINVSAAARARTAARDRTARKNLAALLLAEHHGDAQAAAPDFALLCEALGLTVPANTGVPVGHCIQCCRELPVYTGAGSMGGRFQTDKGRVCSVTCKTRYYRREPPTFIECTRE